MPKTLNRVGDILSYFFIYMKTKNLILSVVILLTVGLAANAQTKNVDLDDFRCPITYRLIPSEPLNPLFFTYSVRVDATKGTENRVSLSRAEEAIVIDGQRKVDSSENPFLTVVVTLGDLAIINSNVEERVVQDKDKEGKVTGTRHYFTSVVNYSFESSYKIFQGNKQLNYVPVDTRSTITHKSREYGTRKEAVDYWNNNRDNLIPNFTTELSMKAVDRASSGASHRYGFYIKKDTEELKIMDTKKHTENEAFRTICTDVKEKFGAVTPNERLKQEDVEEAIEYFKSIPNRYTDIKLKADIKLRYAAYFNLCKIYLYLEDLENVHQYADLLIQNVQDKKDGEKLKKSADELKAMLSKTEIKTRHFDPEEYFNK